MLLPVWTTRPISEVSIHKIQAFQQKRSIGLCRRLTPSKRASSFDTLTIQGWKMNFFICGKKAYLQGVNRQFLQFYPKTSMGIRPRCDCILMGEILPWKKSLFGWNSFKTCHPIESWWSLFNVICELLKFYFSMVAFHTDPLGTQESHHSVWRPRTGIHLLLESVWEINCQNIPRIIFVSSQKIWWPKIASKPNASQAKETQHTVLYATFKLDP